MYDVMMGSPQGVSYIRRGELDLVKVLQPGRRWSATVSLVSWNGQLAVLKDYAQASSFFKATLGRYLVSREAKAYRRAGAVDECPRFLACLETHGFLLQYVEGKNCLESTGIDRIEFFEELDGLLERLRQQGVLHLDVGRNVLVTPEWRPILIDFASSVVIPRPALRFVGWVLRYRGLYDQRAVSKLKRRIAPHLLTKDDHKRLNRKIPLAGLFGFMSRRVNRLVQRGNRDV